MSDEKIYTAFISSVFESMKDERSLVIDALLDEKIYPFAMEHFAIATNEEFEDLKKLIDTSDFFILLLGDSYGSIDPETQLSWTEREYLYAKETKKEIFAISYPQLQKLRGKNSKLLNKDQRRQLEFAENVKCAIHITDFKSAKDVLRKFFSGHKASAIGWERAGLSDYELAQWQSRNERHHLNGEWYHVHLSDSDQTYIRIGTVSIRQDFTPDEFRTLHITGQNYNVLYYDAEEKIFEENQEKFSKFSGEYTLDPEAKTICGIYTTERYFSDGKFASKDVAAGHHRGIHDFNVIPPKEPDATETRELRGTFSDVYPSPKTGRIYIFRTVAERDRFLYKYRGNLIGTHIEQR
jgi:hypothetical protein